MEMWDGQWRTGTNNTGTTTWGTANRALFYPVTISESGTFAYAWICNGATQSGNIDIGVYDAAGVRLTSTGSTVLSGANALQRIDLPAVTLSAGVTYYVGASVDNTTAVFLGAGCGNARMLGMNQATSSFPLPSSVTYATSSFNVFVYFGIARKPYV